jgi:hypothetical protein
MLVFPFMQRFLDLVLDYDRDLFFLPSLGRSTWLSVQFSTKLFLGFPQQCYQHVRKFRQQFIPNDLKLHQEQQTVGLRQRTKSLVHEKFLLGVVAFAY